MFMTDTHKSCRHVVILCEGVKAIGDVVNSVLKEDRKLCHKTAKYSK
jgi:hypothetical protein